jgi:type IV pilus assembly protein PilM
MKGLQGLFSSLKASTVAPAVLGIDVGSSSIKIVQLEEIKQVLTLTTYGEIQVGPYTQKEVGQSVMLSPKQEQEALVDLLRESAATAKQAVFAMPLASSFVTNTVITADDTVDLSALVRIEARKVIPASLSEVTLDWAEMGQSESKDPKQVRERDILIAAIQNGALERFRTLMQFAGLGNPPTEIECFSAIRALNTGAEEHIAIVDIGATSTKLYIAHQGLLARMHRIRIGGAAATNRIASILNCSFEEAEIRKREAIVTDQDYADIKRAHDSTYDRAFKELTQVLQEYEAKTGASLQSVYLTGGGVLFKGIETLMRDTMKRTVVPTNSFSKVSYPTFMEDTIKEIAPSFSVALGAALRSFE